MAAREPETPAARATIAALGERRVISAILDAVQPPASPAGPGDDAARLQLDGPIAVSVDAMVEDTHFRREWMPPYELGFRLVVTSVSDLAAMAARPQALLVSLLLPEMLLVDELEALARGIKEAAATTGLSLVGGDTTGAPLLSASATVIGTIDGDAADTGTACGLRSSAEEGDELWVTGRLGDAAAGLRFLEAWRAAGSGDIFGDGAYLAAQPVDAETIRAALPKLEAVESAAIQGALDAFYRPPTRVDLAPLLRTHKARAIIDLSDGLGSEARHLARASTSGARLEAHALPIGAGALAWEAAAAALDHDDATDPFDLALAGGDDYELFYSIAADDAQPCAQALAAAGCTATRVGNVTDPESGVRLVDGELSRPLDEEGYEHFVE